MNKTIEKIKKVGSSPIFLIAVITYTIGTVLSLVGSTINASAMVQSVMDLLSSSQNIGAVINNAGAMVSAIPIGTIIVNGFSLLCAVGLWVTFFASKSSNPNPSTAGLTVIKTVKIFELVGFVLLYILLALLGVVVAFGAGEVLSAMFEDIPNVTWIFCLVYLVIMLLCAILTISYYSGLMKTIKSIKMTIYTGVIMGKISVFVIVGNYFIAAVTLVNAVISPDIIVLISGVCITVGHVLISVTLSNLRSEMLYIASRGSEAI